CFSSDLRLRELCSFPTRRSSDLLFVPMPVQEQRVGVLGVRARSRAFLAPDQVRLLETFAGQVALAVVRIQSSDEAQRARLQVERSEEHTSELQSRSDLVCRLLLE